MNRVHRMINKTTISSLLVLSTFATNAEQPTNQYRIVDTGQVIAYSDNATIPLPSEGDAFYGQDANYQNQQPSYTDNKDGTIIDNVTGLMWQQSLTEKLTYADALKKVEEFNLAGHGDWRIPTIKELYSLIQFSGSVKGAKAINPFIDTNYFPQPLGDETQGEREIDAQVWSSTEYVGKTMANDDTIFGVNFVDGRIKGYPKFDPRTHDAHKMYFRFVRNNEAYGENNFVDNKNETVTDAATGLTWQKSDGKKGLIWQDALQYCETLNLGGHDDWRLPNAKELQSIVDYTRSPETSNSAAINPVFNISTITNEAGETDYPYFWTSTTHLDGPTPEGSAAYFAFGKALGKMRDTVMDVHGAGAQRSDPKTGQAMSRGPQGDMIRVENYVRCVNGGVTNATQISERDIQQNTFSYSTTSQSSMASSNDLLKSTTSNKHKHANKFIERLDKNEDGKVSSAEFHGKNAQFNHLDKNGDGYITIDEAPTGPPNKKNNQ